MKKKILIVLSCILFFLIGIIIGRNIDIHKEKQLVLNNNQMMVDGLGIINIEKENEEEFTNNVTPIKIMYASKINSLDRKIQIYGINNNFKYTNIELEMDFFDENGFMIDFKSISGILLPNREYVLTIEYSDSDTYKSYKLKYKAYEADSKYETLYDENKIEYSSVKTSNNEVIISFKNKNENKIGKIYFSCILYNDKKVVGALSVSDNNISYNKGNSLRCVPNKTGLIFNDYKVILTQILNVGELGEI